MALLLSSPWHPRFLTGKVSFDSVILVLDMATFDLPTSVRGAILVEQMTMSQAIK